MPAATFFSSVTATDLSVPSPPRSSSPYTFTQRLVAASETVSSVPRPKRASKSPRASQGSIARKENPAVLGRIQRTLAHDLIAARGSRPVEVTRGAADHRCGARRRHEDHAQRCVAGAHGSGAGPALAQQVERVRTGRQRLEHRQGHGLVDAVSPVGIHVHPAVDVRVAGRAVDANLEVGLVVQVAAAPWRRWR